MSNYYSGVFEPDGAGRTNNAGAACWFDGALYFFNTATAAGNRVHLLTCSQPAGDLFAPGAWTSAELPEDQIRAQVDSAIPTMPVALGDSLYLMWFDADWQHVAVTRLGPDGQWSPYGAVQNMKGVPVGGGGADCSAVAIGPSQILLSEVNRATLAITWHLYDLAGFEPGSPWKAIRQSGTPAAVLAERAGVKGLIGVASSGSAWFSQGGDETTTRLSENILMQTFQATTQAGSQAIVAAIQLDALNTPVVAPTSRAWAWNDVWAGAVLRRDPGGRIVAVAANASRRLQIRTLPTRPALSKLAWSAAAPLFGNEETEARYGAAADFVLGAPVNEGNDFEARLIVFSAKNRVRADIECQAAYYGRLARAIDVEVLDLTEVSKSPAHPSGIQLLRGYIDGPVPIPNLNVQQDPGAVTGSIVYGHTRSSSVVHEVAQDWNVGVKTEAEIGIGATLLWETAISGGAGSTFGTAAIETASQRQRQRNEVKDGKIIPLGTAFLDDIHVHRDEYLFYPAGSAKPAEDAPLFAQIYATFTSAGSRAFPVQTTEPGVLASYTREAWDKRMGKDYFKKQVEDQALDLDHNGTVKKALPFSWTMSGDIGASSGWTVSSFAETRWTFHSEVYAGAKFSFWGVPSAKFMVGSTFDLQTKTRTVNDDTWGIDATFEVPAPNADPLAVQEYDFELFFLPALRQWTDEFIDLVGAVKPELVKSIDPNSESWKIVCLVTRIVYNGAVSALTAHGLSPDAIAALRADGIGTIAQLCQHHRVRPHADAMSMRLDDPGLSESHRPALTAARDWVIAHTYRDPMRQKPSTAMLGMVKPLR